MRTKPLAVGDTLTWSGTQPTHVARLIRLISEIKVNPQQTPHQLCHALGISRARFFEDLRHLRRRKLPPRTCGMSGPSGPREDCASTRWLRLPLP
jgi:hypothetical protein